MTRNVLANILMACVVLVLCLIIGGCGGGGTPAPQGQKPREAGDAEPIRAGGQEEGEGFQQGGTRGSP